MPASPPAADIPTAPPKLHYAPAPSRRRRTIRRALYFTIAYTLNNHPGTIDGWLNDDDTVKLQVREGSATLFPTIRR